VRQNFWESSAGSISRSTGTNRRVSEADTLRYLLYSSESGAGGISPSGGRVALVQRQGAFGNVTGAAWPQYCSVKTALRDVSCQGTASAVASGETTMSPSFSPCGRQRLKPWLYPACAGTAEAVP
jgi:hypothetical protein